MSDFRTYAIILAAGRGERMQADKNKMLMKIGDQSLLEICLDRFHRNESIDHLFLVVPEDVPAEQMLEEQEVLKGKYPKLEALLNGGKTRQDSVYQGLQAVKNHAADYSGRKLVLIHDGARSFVPSAVLERVVSALKSERVAVVAALAATDTIREIKDCVLTDLDVTRDKIFQMQTPQAADLDIFLHAFELAQKGKFQATDDIALLLRIGYPVRVIAGDKRNFKLTTPEDFEMARLLFAAGYFAE